MTILTDVAVLLGRALTTAEEARATRLIEIATATVEAELPGFTVAAGTETAIVYPGDPDVVWTPRYPVTDVTTVAVAGNTMTGFGWTDRGCISLTPVTLLNEWEINVTGCIPLPVEITYDFGLATLPADVSGAIAAPVADVLRRQATNPGNAMQTTLGAFSESYGQDAVAAAARGIAAPMLARTWQRATLLGVPFAAAGVYPGGFQSSSSVGS